MNATQKAILKRVLLSPFGVPYNLVILDSFLFEKALTGLVSDKVLIVDNLRVHNQKDFDTIRIHPTWKSKPFRSGDYLCGYGYVTEIGSEDITLESGEIKPLSILAYTFPCTGWLANKVIKPKESTYTETRAINCAHTTSSSDTHYHRHSSTEA